MGTFSLLIAFTFYAIWIIMVINYDSHIVRVTNFNGFFDPYFQGQGSKMMVGFISALISLLCFTQFYKVISKALRFLSVCCFALSVMLFVLYAIALM